MEINKLKMKKIILMGSYQEHQKWEGWQGWNRKGQYTGFQATSFLDCPFSKTWGQVWWILSKHWELDMVWLWSTAILTGFRPGNEWGTVLAMRQYKVESRDVTRWVFGKKLQFSFVKEGKLLEVIPVRLWVIIINC